MTYLQLCQKMIRDLGLQNTLNSVADQTGMNRKIVDWVADADEHIQSLWFDWDFLWSQVSTTTSVGTRQINKPSDLGTWDKEALYLDYTSDDYIHLTELDYRTWRQNYRNGTQSNDEPSQFIILPNKNIYLEPAPDGEYLFTADYWKTPTRMSVNGDTSPIPDRFERIILAKAKIYWAEHEEFGTVFDLANAEYKDLLSRLEATELPNKTDMGMSTADFVVRSE